MIVNETPFGEEIRARSLSPSKFGARSSLRALAAIDGEGVLLLIDSGSVESASDLQISCKS